MTQKRKKYCINLVKTLIHYSKSFLSLTRLNYSGKPLVVIFLHLILAHLTEKLRKLDKMRFSEKIRNNIRMMETQ